MGIILGIAVFFWLLHMPSHRTAGRINKIQVGRFLAMCAGSRDERVDWRSFSFQIGAVSLVPWYILFFFLEVRNMVLVFPCTAITIGIVQLCIRLLNRDKPLP